MTLYRILAPTFIGGSLRETGEVVDYDGRPGSTLQPIETNAEVKIAADWRTLNGLQRIALARSLGAPKSRMSADAADQWIVNELDNRELKAGNKPAPTVAPETTASASASTALEFQGQRPLPSPAIPPLPDHGAK